VLLGLEESDPESGRRTAALESRLAELGWRSPNIRLHYRMTADTTRMPALASEMVALAPDVIVVHTNIFLAALREVNRGIPIVFAQVGDPVGSGFVDNLSRPGGTITGFSAFSRDLGAKWPELLKQAAPPVTRALVLFEQQSAANRALLETVEPAARSLALELTPVAVHDAGEIERAIRGYDADRAGLIVLPASVTAANKALICRLATQQRLPAVYPFRFFVADAGGLMAYGTDTVDLVRRAAEYVDRILRGAKPADLPIQEPTRYELVINLAAARAIGLTLPPVLLARATEIVE
jgi:ABC-type uncharacterized transport system substrate-binding protein